MDDMTKALNRIADAMEQKNKRENEQHKEMMKLSKEIQKIIAPFMRPVRVRKKNSNEPITFPEFMKR